jgi:magnesium chelatase subunit D
MSNRHTKKTKEGSIRSKLTEHGFVRPLYPFAGIQGQADMKLALVLNVVDPLIGGVLIMGHRGTGKSTAVRALSELVPEIKVVSGCVYQCDPANTENICGDCATRLGSGKKTSTHKQAVKVVELPLGATEDRVCGTINIERALKEGATTFEPGLLAQANRGFLYIDEVNLLEDHLVDVLLDVAATGWNRVEREGISVEHPSRFVLIGSGNPEEGELRPQLLDRFGLHVEVKTEDDPDSRVAVVQRREAFDRDPAAFTLEFAGEQQELVKTIERARRNFARIQIGARLLKKVAQLCTELKIEGHRGELTLMRAARALAAIKGRKIITDDDLRRIAPMALQHRLRSNAFEDATTRERILQTLDQTLAPESDVDRNQEGDQQPLGSGKGSHSRRSEHKGTDNVVDLFANPPAKSGTELHFDWKPNDRNPSLRERKSAGPRRKATSELRGRHTRSVRYKTASRKIAMAATLRAMLVTSAADISLAGSLRYKLFAQKRGTLFVFLIDTSGSMGRYRIALAKRAILDLLRQSYVNRDSVAIITFRGVSATVALAPSRSILRAKRAIESLTVGGSTPLSAGMMCAAELVRRVKDQHADKSVLVFTDGRANVPLRNQDESSLLRDRLIEDEVKQLGAAIRQTRTNLVVVDTQRHFESSGDAARLARLMEAQLIKLE